MIAADTTAQAAVALAPMRPAATCVRRDKSHERVVPTVDERRYISLTTLI
jgi:hypothetical protein